VDIEFILSIVLFLFASRPAIMRRVLGIVYRVIIPHLIKKAGAYSHDHPDGDAYLDPALR